MASKKYSFYRIALIAIVFTLIVMVNLAECALDGTLDSYYPGPGRIANNPPKLTRIGDKQVNENEMLRFSVIASDPDPGDKVTLSASGLPANASFNKSSGAFSFKPDYSQSG